MSTQANETEVKKYYCPFCSQEILPEEVLFADEDKNASIAEEDPERYANLESRVLQFHDVSKPDGSFISMDTRPIYKFHRWKKPSNDELPFMEPLDLSESAKTTFPEDITVFRRNGMTPKQLSGQMAPPWAVVNTEKPAETPEPEKKESAAAMLRRAMMGTPKASTEPEESTAQLYENVQMTLTEKACPHCHSILPENFGELETYRIAMLGGTRSGKTTYMVSTANLLKRQSGLPSGVISGCTICKESALYFDFLIKCMEYNRLAATVLDDQTVIRFVFPIVMNIAAVTEDGGEREFILIINDIPGEAMVEKSFMINYPGLCQANAAIMLMDPMQFITSSSEKSKLAKMDLEMISGFTAEPEAVRNHLTEAFTPLTFGETLANVKKMIVDSKFRHLSCFALVLNKLDLLYGGDNPYIDEETAASISYIHGHYQLGKISESQTQHEDGVDLELIRRISDQVVYLIENKLNFKSYSSTIQPLLSETGEIMTLCTSVRNWNAGRSCFCRQAEEDGYTPAETLLGFRMMEPLLYALAKLGLVRVKEHIDEEPEVDQPTHGWFYRLFHKR